MSEFDTLIKELRSIIGCEVDIYVKKWGIFGNKFSNNKDDLKTARCNNLYLLIRYPLNDHVWRAADELDLSHFPGESNCGTLYYKNWFNVFFPINNLDLIEKFNGLVKSFNEKEKEREIKRIELQVNEANETELHLLNCLKRIKVYIQSEVKE
jgi:hypothetical protein